MLKYAAVIVGLTLAVPAMAQEAKPSTERERRAAQILHQMLDPQIAASMAKKQSTGGFGGEMTRLSVENAYEQLWTRPGLGLRDRSLVTIAMLIAIGAERELRIHLEAGLRNGLTPQELEEVIYQSSAYVGFPRASNALAIASEVMAKRTARK